MFFVEENYKLTNSAITRTNGAKFVLAIYLFSSCLLKHDFASIIECLAFSQICKGVK